LKRLAVVLVAACAQAPAARAPAAAPAPAGPLFEFHSDPWVNLHQRLYAEATANQYWHSKVETCACGKGPEWGAAVDGYKKELGEKDRNPTFDPGLQRTNFALALAGERLPENDVDPVVAKWIAPVYDAYARERWPVDDARNRAWIATVEPLVQRWGRDIANEYETRFRIRWPGRVIRVEVTEFAGFGGAYTSSDPILVTMSSADAGYQGNAALEMLFHESSHGLDQILTHDLRMAFLARGKREPDRLDHAIIFYTAGALVKKRLGPSYVPYAYAQGVWKRGWAAYEAALRVHWQAFLDEAIDFETALDRLATAL
jgi:hypothetical protein